MVKKLLVLLFVVILFVFSVSQSHAQTSQDISCSDSNPCPSQINCSVGCLSVSLMCVNGLCRVPSGGTCTNTFGMSNGGCIKTNQFGGTAGNQYCTKNPSVGNYTCQPSSPDGTSCLDNSECQPNAAFGGDRVCAVNLCGTSPRGASCCPSGKFWCSSTNSCTNQGDGSCPCEATQVTPTSIPTPTSGGTASGPTPTPSSTCKSNGIVSLSYSRTGCFNPLEAKSATVTCNEGTQKTFTSSFLCLATFQFDNSALSFCSTHKACPTPSPLPPTATTAPRVTPQSLTCDPVKDGVINNADYDLWLKEYTHQVNTTLTACFVPGDNTVNILDFQVWKDINYGLRPPNAPISNPPQTTPTSTPSPVDNATPTPVAMTNELITLITNNNKAGIKSWASPKSISDLNFAVSHLSQTQRDSLASIILDTNLTGADRDKILIAFKKVLNNPSTGFYADIWSYTRINIASSITGYTTSCNTVNLNTNVLTLPDSDILDILMHESLHSFNCTNNGPAGALNEGSAIWVYKVAFPDGRNPDELTAGFAETVFGTINYYRDISVGGSTFSALNAVTTTNPKLLELFNWLSTTDGSHLPWNSQTKLDYCYNTYYKSILRTDSQWFAKAKAASIAMAADPQCRK